MINIYFLKKFSLFYDAHLNMLLKQVRAIPHTFDASKRWPNCSTNILRIMNQGGCGSCWVKNKFFDIVTKFFFSTFFLAFESYFNQ